MCKTKADGGARCAFHLEQGVQTGVTFFVSAVTGLSPREAAATYDGLRREGAGLPDPPRVEVDGFLEEQAFRVRHEPTLSESRRLSIGDRLRPAIGRVLPDGATFHPWENVVAEAWAGSGRKVAAVFLAGALSFGVGACGNVPADQPDPPRGGPAATAPANPSPSVEVEKVSIEEALVAPTAVQQFGRTRANAAYREVTTFAAANTFRTDLLRPKASYTEADFAEVGKFMNPPMRAVWNNKIAARARGDEKSENDINVLMFHNFNVPGHSLTTSGPAIVNQKISKVSVAPENPTSGTGRIAVTFTQAGDLRLSKGGQPMRVTIDKTVTCWLAPAPSGSGRTWLIDGYKGSYEMHKITPDGSR
jgi:hypothetical protein